MRKRQSDLLGFRLTLAQEEEGQLVELEGTH